MEITYKQFIDNILETRGRFACGDEYHERHHIIPRCMGGANDEENLIDLFAREHFEAHRLLALENLDNKKLTHAWWMMSTMLDSGNRQIKITPEEYEEARNKFSQSMLGANNPMYGKPSPKRGTHLTDEQKLHLREINLGERHPKYGKQLSEEIKSKISTAHLGKIASQEARLNMSNAHLGRNMGADSPRAKRIAQYGLDGVLIKIWDCVSDAARALNVSISSISNVCCGVNKSAAGYQWRYVVDSVIPRIDAYTCQSGKYQIKTIARCDDDWNIIDVWQGCVAAQNGTGINKSHISSCCNGKRQRAGGYKWKILNKNNEEGSTTIT